MEDHSLNIESSKFLVRRIFITYEKGMGKESPDFSSLDELRDPLMIITNTVELLKLHYESLMDDKIKNHVLKMEESVEKILAWIEKNQEK